MQARTRGKDYFQCPECRKETRLPANDPDRLATINSKKKLDRRLTRTAPEESAMSKLCVHVRSHTLASQPHG